MISGLLTLAVSGTVSAQQKNPATDTTIKGSTIEITQIYQPQIKQTVKETITPTLPPAEQTAGSFKYDVPNHSLNYNYKATPLQPLALAKDSLQSGYKGYVKAGFGNLRTLFLDAAAGDIKMKNFSSKIHLGILSQKGNLNFQRQTVAALTAEGRYAKNKFVSDVELKFSHDNFFQYGYDQLALPNKSATRQTLTGGSLGFGIYPAGKEMTDRFKPVITARLALYTGNNISGENTGAAGLSFFRKFGSSGWSTHLGVQATGTNLSSEFYSVSNSYAFARLGAAYSEGNFSFRAYLMPTIGQNNNTFLLNDIEGKYYFEKVQATIGTGIKGSLTQNTYQQLFQTNPYISSFPSVQTHSNEVFAFVEKGLGHHLFITGKVSWWQYENLATFVNDYSTGNSEKMSAYYIPSLNAVSLQAGLRYQIANTLSLGAQLALFNYANIYNATPLKEQKVWHTPTKKMTADLLWNPIKDLSISFYFAYLGGNFAMDQNADAVKLKPVTDLGFGAEYLALKKLSFFLNFNNVLNNKYQRWQGYQAYGINIYGGVRLKF